jgi:hypothetical protein
VEGAQLEDEEREGTEKARKEQENIEEDDQGMKTDVDQ